VEPSIPEQLGGQEFGRNDSKNPNSDHNKDADPHPATKQPKDREEQ